MYWPNSLDCTDLNQCGACRDAELEKIEKKMFIVGCIFLRRQKEIGIYLSIFDQCVVMELLQCTYILCD